MPTSSLKPAMMGSPMAVSYPASYRPDDIIIGPLSNCAIGNEITGLTSGFGTVGTLAWPAASRILAYPFTLIEPYLVRKVWWQNGGTAAGTDSTDVGVFTEDGVTKLVSSGSTAATGTNVVQEVDVTDTLIYPGRYWCCAIQGGTTNTRAGINVAATLLRVCGCAQMAGSGSTLPAGGGTNFVPAAVAGTGLAFFGIACRTQVA